MTATDNGFNTRLERRGGNYPILERRQRTLARVNDEIVATIVADLRAAGIEAQPGSEASLGFGDNAVLVSGRLYRAGAQARTRKSVSAPGAATSSPK